MNQDIELINYLAKKDKEIEKLYHRLLYQLGKISLNLTKIREGAFFSFDDYPELKAKVDDILYTYTIEQQDIIINGINKAVRMSFQANNELFEGYSRYSETALTDMRRTAADAFIISRMKPEQGLSLSQRVWNYTRQTKAEFEAGMSEILEEGLLEGTSAEELGRKLRDKLKYPDMVYKRYHLKKMTAKGKKDVVEWRRKVVDSNGKVRYIKEDLEKVGRGVYRSSRKNALRLTATEINMAYRYADHVRWKNEPFVTGFKIELSGNHPVYDMCDELIGIYPKTFLWRGWHPRCRCIATPTLISESEMKKIADLPDDEYNRYRSKHLVKKMPKKYDEYIKKNHERILDAQSKGTTPYWVRDNYKKGDIREKFVWERIGKTKFKTSAEKKAIQEAWDLRRHKNSIEAARVKRHANRDAKAIQEAWDKRKEKYSKIMKTASNVYHAAKNDPWVNTDNLVWLFTRKKYHLLPNEYKKVAKEINDVKKKKTQLSTLIPDVDDWAKQFSYEELKETFEAIKKKLNYLSTLSLEKQQHKLMYEINDYLGGNINDVQNKYPTWMVSQSAYKKQLKKVEEKIFEQQILKDIDKYSDWLYEHKKATSVANELYALQTAVANGASPQALMQLSKLVQERIDKVEEAAAKRLAKKTGKTIDKDAFSKKRKDNALWFNSTNKQSAYNEADRYMSQYAEENWSIWNNEQKHVGYLYTSGSRYINEPLFARYWGTKVSDIDGTIRDSWTDINTLTDMIDKSTPLKNDIWVQHGEDMNAFIGKFGVDLDYQTKAELKKLIGKTGINKPFTSCGSSKGSGFANKDVILNIYCPKGTKFIYTEPYSHYGDSMYRERGIKWDGTPRQAQGYDCSDENEIILQRGAIFKITKIEKSGSTWYIDVDLIEQPEKLPNII